MMRKSTDKNSTQNGVSFDQAKAIRNAIITDDVSELKKLLISYEDINFQLEWCVDDYALVDWSSDVRPMSICENFSLLHFAVLLGRKDCVELLIHLKADVNLYSIDHSDKEYHTPLHKVATGYIDEKSMHQDVTRLLLQNGADLELRISKQLEKQTALELIEGVEKKVKKTPRLFEKYFSPLNPRTEAADEALIVIREHQNTKSHS